MKNLTVKDNEDEDEDYFESENTSSVKSDREDSQERVDEGCICIRKCPLTFGFILLALGIFGYIAIIVCTLYFKYESEEYGKGIDEYYSDDYEYEEKDEEYDHDDKNNTSYNVTTTYNTTNLPDSEIPKNRTDNLGRGRGNHTIDKENIDSKETTSTASPNKYEESEKPIDNSNENVTSYNDTKTNNTTNSRDRETQKNRTDNHNIGRTNHTIDKENIVSEETTSTASPDKYEESEKPIKPTVDENVTSYNDTETNNTTNSPDTGTPKRRTDNSSRGKNNQKVDQENIVSEETTGAASPESEKPIDNPNTFDDNVTSYIDTRTNNTNDTLTTTEPPSKLEDCIKNAQF